MNVTNINNRIAANLHLNTDYQNALVVNGNLPEGISLTLDGILIGKPIIANVYSYINEYNYNFTIQANSISSGAVYNDTYTLAVTKGIAQNENDITARITNLGNRYSINLINQTGQSGTWQLASGILPPNTSFNSNGSIDVNTDYNLLPFLREQFVDATLYHSPQNIKEWNKWLELWLQENKKFDYSFTVECVDANNSVLIAYSLRIIHTLPPLTGYFEKYANQLRVDPTQNYYLIFDSQNQAINWVTDANLGIMDNGTVSELSLLAQTKNSALVYYSMKPIQYSRLPQGLTLNRNGNLMGRISFRTHMDDPANVPNSNIYEFTVRAYTKNYRTYSDKKFTLTINRKYSQPLDNIWLYAMTGIENRFSFERLVTLLKGYDSFIYRNRDPRFGVSQRIKILFAVGIQAKSIPQYENILLANHYDKTLTFDQARIAYALGPNLETQYEVIYFPVIDPKTGRSSINTTSTPTVEINLKDKILNYYVKDGQTFYKLTPNTLENMQAVLRAQVGTNTLDLMPRWMTSIQPIEGRTGVFSAPIGFISAFVLCYCRAGQANKVLSIINNYNFNRIEFTFDRYQLENQHSVYYRNSVFVPGSNVTLFDSGTTILDSNSTKVVENIESYYHPDFGNKYLKFPKNNVFR